jgi:1-acyl-sn-glycerol-3-phosphate acyltransferase
MGARCTATTIGEVERPAPRRTACPVGALRSASRCAGFALVLVLAAVDYIRVLCVCRRSEPMRRRALWLQRWSRILSRLIGLELSHSGTAPRSGLIISNHLSYLDILAYSALAPSVFVAKKEVGSWPFLGLFARMGGTIFVDRTRRMKVAGTNRRIADVLRTGTAVVLFAEGTSSDGRTVLPFRSPLLEAATCAGSTVVPAAIRYHLDEGSVADEVCYWRDMTLVPHLINLFAKRRVQARIAFGSAQTGAMLPGRKEAARQLHEQVVGLHTTLEKTSSHRQ